MNDPREFHVDAFLSTLATGFRPKDFIADQIFPRVTVAKQSNIFATIPKGGWFRIDATNRAPGTKANEVTYTVGSDTYFCPNYELAHKVAWETLDNADPPFRPLQTGTQLVITKLELDYEDRVRSTIASGVGSVMTLSGTDVWTDPLNSDPYGNFETAKNAIFDTTGEEPNVCIIPRRVVQVLATHPDVIARTHPGGAGGGTATLGQIRDMIFGEGTDGRILVAKTLKDTSADGATTNAFTPVWSSNVTLMRVDPNPSADMVKTFGLTFLWTGANIGMKSPGNWQVERKRDADVKADWVRTGYYQDEKIVSAELGFEIRTGI
jgi:hypothetical protein